MAESDAEIRAEWVKRQLDAAPPLSTEQRKRLATLLDNRRTVVESEAESESERG